jgi:hypothetical protein
MTSKVVELTGNCASPSRLKEDHHRRARNATGKRLQTSAKLKGAQSTIFISRNSSAYLGMTRKCERKEEARGQGGYLKNESLEYSKTIELKGDRNVILPIIKKENAKL